MTDVCDRRRFLLSLGALALLPGSASASAEGGATSSITLI